MEILFNIFVAYLIIGIIAGLGFYVGCVIEDIKGKIDPKFGPAYRSSMTYFLTFTMVCPLVNLLWVYIFFIDWRRKYVRE